jgi:hypothetical protein
MTLPHNPYVRPLDPIETDEMFGVWNRNLPRLWYLDQRSATRMDAESLYGATLFAIFQSRSVFDSVPVVTDAVGVGLLFKTRSLFEATQIPLESVGGVRNFIRMTSESLPVVEDVATRIRPSTSPVSPIVHNVPPDEGTWHG